MKPAGEGPPAGAGFVTGRRQVLAGGLAVAIAAGARGDVGLAAGGRAATSVPGVARGAPATSTPATSAISATAAASVSPMGPVGSTSPAAPAGEPAAGHAAARGGNPLPKVIVLNSRDATISLIEQATFAESARLDVGKEPHHLYPTPDGSQLIVASSASDELFFLDPVTGVIQHRLRGIDDPYQLAFSPDRQWFVTAALRLDRVDIYAFDGRDRHLVRRVPMPKLPSHLWFSGDSRHVFVTLQGSNEVAAIDVVSQQVLWRMSVGKQPAGIILSPDEQYLFVGIMGEDHVQVIDWRQQKLVTRIQTGGGAHNFRGMGDQRRLLVSNRVADSISCIDMTTLKVLDTVEVAGGPDCMDLGEDGRSLWVTSRWARRVALIDLVDRRMVTSIPVGRSPHGIYLHNRAPVI